MIKISFLYSSSSNFILAISGAAAGPSSKRAKKEPANDDPSSLTKEQLIKMAEEDSLSKFTVPKLKEIISLHIQDESNMPPSGVS